MKLLTQLSAQVIEATWSEPRGIVTAVHDEPAPGFFRSITLGAGGVLVTRGNASVGIPLAEILALAEKQEPSLKPVPGAPVATRPPKSRTAIAAAKAKLATDH